MKKIFSLLLMIGMFLGISVVKAESVTLTKEQFVEKLNLALKDIGNSQNETTAKLEEDKVGIYDGEEKMMELTFEGNVLSHNFTATGEDSDVYNLLNYASFYNVIMNVVGESKGYTERDIRLFKNENATLENDGYLIKINDDSLEFKIDLENFKLTLAYVEGKKPTIVIGTIGDMEINVGATVPDEEGVMVEIYRSLDGEKFEYIGSVSNSTTSSQAYITDTELIPNTEYYYKAVVEKSSVFSDIVKVTTLETVNTEDTDPDITDPNENTDKDSNNKSDADKPAENPKTGGITILSISLLGVILASLTIILKKNKLYKL